jgi:hypothetical protein
MEGSFRLSPVTFDPDVAVAVVVPVAIDPAGMGVGWLNVGSRNPDVAITVPPMVAGVPRIVGVLVGRGRDVFNGAGRRTDADYDLGLCDTCGEKECAGDSGEYFFHRCYLLMLLT